MENGWLHMTSTSGDNGANQFYITNSDITFDQSEGYLEFTLKPVSSASNTLLWCLSAQQRHQRRPVRGL